MPDDEPYRLCTCPQCSHPKCHAADEFFQCFTCGCKVKMDTIAVETYKNRREAVERKDDLMRKYKEKAIERENAKRQEVAALKNKGILSEQEPGRYKFIEGEKKTP